MFCFKKTSVMHSSLSIYYTWNSSTKPPLLYLSPFRFPLPVFQSFPAEAIKCNLLLIKCKKVGMYSPPDRDILNSDTEVAAATCRAVFTPYFPRRVWRCPVRVPAKDTEFTTRKVVKKYPLSSQNIQLVIVDLPDVIFFFLEYSGSKDICKWTQIL